MWKKKIMKRKRRIYKLKPRGIKRGRGRPPYIKYIYIYIYYIYIIYIYIYFLDVAKNKKAEVFLGDY